MSHTMFSFDTIIISGGQAGLSTGLHFLYAAASVQLHGVERDAKRIVQHIVPTL